MTYKDIRALNPELSFEISEIDKPIHELIDELQEYVKDRYGKHWKFNRTEKRYMSCIVAIFEEVDW